jgi:hypothetical protein
MALKELVNAYNWAEVDGLMAGVVPLAGTHHSPQ